MNQQTNQTNQTNQNLTNNLTNNLKSCQFTTTPTITLTSSPTINSNPKRRRVKWLGLNDQDSNSHELINLNSSSNINNNNNLSRNSLVSNNFHLKLTKDSFHHKNLSNPINSKNSQSINKKSSHSINPIHSPSSSTPPPPPSSSSSSSPSSSSNLLLHQINSSNNNNNNNHHHHHHHIENLNLNLLSKTYHQNLKFNQSKLNSTSYDSSSNLSKNSNNPYFPPISSNQFNHQTNLHQKNLHHLKLILNPNHPNLINKIPSTTSQSDYFYNLNHHHLNHHLNHSSSIPNSSHLNSPLNPPTLDSNLLMNQILTPDPSRPTTPDSDLNIPFGEKDGLPSNPNRQPRTFTREAANLVSLHKFKINSNPNNSNNNPPTSNKNLNLLKSKKIFNNNNNNKIKSENFQSHSHSNSQKSSFFNPNGVLSSLLQLYNHPLSAQSSSATLINYPSDDDSEIAGYNSSDHHHHHHHHHQISNLKSQFLPTSSINNKNSFSNPPTLHQSNSSIRSSFDLVLEKKNQIALTLSKVVDKLDLERPSGLKSKAGVLGALQASAIGLGGVAAPSATNVAPAPRKTGYKLARYLNEPNLSILSHDFQSSNHSSNQNQNQNENHSLNQNQNQNENQNQNQNQNHSSNQNENQNHSILNSDNPYLSDSQPHSPNQNHQNLDQLRRVHSEAAVNLTFNHQNLTSSSSNSINQLDPSIHHHHHHHHQKFNSSHSTSPFKYRLPKSSSLVSLKAIGDALKPTNFHNQSAILKAKKSFHPNHSISPSTTPTPLDDPFNEKVLLTPLALNHQIHNHKSNHHLHLTSNHLQRNRKRKEKRRQEEIFITMHVAAILQRQQFILQLTRALMMFGGPSHRLESQIQSTARVLEINLQIILFYSVCIFSFQDEATHTSETKFIKQNSQVDLGKLTDLTTLHWEVVHDKIGVQEASQEISKLMLAKPAYNAWKTVLIGAMCSVFIGPAGFNASFLDLLVSAPLGAGLVATQLFVASKSDVFSQIFEIVVTGFTSFIASALASTGYFCYSAVIASSIVLILPGWLVCCAALELQSRCIVSGSVRLIWAIIYALFLGIGISLGAEFWTLFSRKSVLVSLNGTCDSSHSKNHWYQQTIPLWSAFIVVPGYALFLAMRLQSRLNSKEIWVMVLLASIGWTANHFAAIGFPNRPDISSAIGSFVVGFLANLYGRMFQGTAFIVALVPILFQLPSGLGNGGGFLNFANTENPSQSFLNGFQVGIQLLEVSLGLVIGLFVATVLVYPLGNRRGGLMTF